MPLPEGVSMVQTCYRFILPAALLFAFSSTATAAPFLLPDDAIIEIREFSFPASSAASSAASSVDAPERNLPAELHSRLEHAMRQSGFVIFEGNEITVPAASSPESSDAPMPMSVTPLPPEQPVNTPDDTPPSPENTEDGAEGNDETDLPADDEMLAGEEAVRGIFAMPGEYAGAEIAPQTEPHKISGATHILEGNVTLFRETVGNPTRVGGSIRIRTEALLHCTYKIRDAATGKVIISDTSSGSSARVAAQDQDIDAALAALSIKAMDATAAKIAANLSGTQPPGDNAAGGRGYYQDSPGKRLKPGK